MHLITGQPMLSIRTLFLAGLTVYMLPTDPAQQQRFMEKAMTAAHWTTTFCDRNVTTCEVASGVWAEMKEKATFGFALAYDIATRKSGSAPAASTIDSFAERPQAWPVSSRPAPTGTLTQDDLRPVWRGHPAP